MKSTIAFFLIQLLAFALVFPLAQKPYLEELRPAMISETPTENNIVNLFQLVLVGTLVLIGLRLLKITLRFMADLAVFVSFNYLAAFLGADYVAGLLVALAALLLRQADNLLLFNLTTSAAIVSFSLMFGMFLNPELVLFLMALMSVYDVIAVFYTKHMKFIWFDDLGKKRPDNVKRIPRPAVLNLKYPQNLSAVNPAWRNSLALIFPQEVKSGVSIYGSGDFALPTVLTVAMTNAVAMAGVISMLCSLVGFVWLKKFAEQSLKTKETGIPGVPILALCCALSLLLSRAFGLAV